VVLNKDAQAETKPKSQLKVEKDKTHEGRTKGLDPGLSEERKKEVRRLRKNEQSRISHARRRESAASATSTKVAEGSSSPPKAHEHSSVIKPPPKPSAHNVLPQGMNTSVTLDINLRSSLTPKPKKSNKPVLGVAAEKIGGTSANDQKAPLFSPPRKASVILPPKTRAPGPK
jgi:hypothetical protein